MSEIERLIEAGSLGTPAAKAARASVSDEQVQEVLRLSKEIERDMIVAVRRATKSTH